MVPEDVGISGSELVLGKHSGRHGLIARLKQLGYTIAPAELEKIYTRFIELADKKKNVYDDDIVSLMHAEDLAGPQAFTLDYLHVSTGTVLPTATVRLKKGKEIFGPASACGDGPVDAMFKAIDLITKEPGTLLDYSLQAVTKGEDAVGEVSVSVRFGKELVVAKGASTDIVEASAKAYLNSLNRYLFEKGQQKIKAQPRGDQP
jgi:2-isopropylmalate synthase